MIGPYRDPIISSSVLLAPVGVALLGLSLVVRERSVRMQVVMTATLAAVIASTLFVILILDNPWSGDTALKPEAFEHIHTMQGRMQHDIIVP